MAKFIPVQKMKTLREASRNGDDRAKKILEMQLKGTEDFGSLLDEYFAPKPEQTESAQVEETSTGATNVDKGLQEFLEFNQINEDSPDYQSYVDDYYKENPKPQNGLGEVEHNEEHNHEHEYEHSECESKEQLEKVRKEEVDAVDSYSKAITVVMNDTTVDDNKKRKIISRLKEIRGDEEEHFRELNELLVLLGSDNVEEVEKIEKNEGTLE